jgi:succinyl-CoA synthetase alpha subunit
MGHAGAIVGGDDDTAQAKKKIMRDCGIIVVDSPADIGKAMAKALADESRTGSPHHHANRVD